MSSVPQPQNAVRPIAGVNSPAVATSEKAVVNDGTQGSIEKDVARFGLETQAAFNEQAAKLLEQQAARIEAEGTSAIDAALAAAVEQLRRTCAELARGQANRLREVASALRATGA